MFDKSRRYILQNPHTICFWLLPAAFVPIKSPDSSEPVLRQLRRNLEPKGADLFVHKLSEDFPSNIWSGDNSHQPFCEPHL